MKPTVLERGFRLVRALQTRGRMSADALADELGVSVRTIYRDVEELLMHGIAIRGTPGPDGGYELDTERGLSPLDLSSEEDFRQLLGKPGPTPQPGGPLDELEAAACAELGLSGRVIVGTARSRVFFDPSDWYWSDEPTPVLIEARRAVLANRVIELFRPHADPRLLVRPYGLVWKAGQWYLVGAELTGDIRRWNLARISDIEATDMWFEPPSHFDLRAWWAENLEEHGKGDIAVSFVAVGQSGRELRKRLRLKDESEVVQSDTETRFTLYVDDWTWLVPLLGSFMGKVVITNPPELVDQVGKMFARAAAAQRRQRPLPDDGVSPGLSIAATRGREPRAT